VKLEKMRFQSRLERSTFKVAECFEPGCGWRVTSVQTPYINNNAREHCQQTGHTVEVISTRTSVYTAGRRDG
jgi:hypothetical protein